MTCDELRAVAAELALDELTGAERAAALAHLGGCTTCRAEVADLAAIADSVLLLAPSVEPPSGFESRVLARIAPAPRRARRWPAVAAAAAVVAILGGTIGFALADRNAEPSLPAAAVLVNADGLAAGSVVLAGSPDRITCVFEDERFGGAYEVEVELADGTVIELGGFSTDGAPWSWTVELPVDARDVRAVRVRDAEGVVRASAVLA